MYSSSFLITSGAGFILFTKENRNLNTELTFKFIFYPQVMLRVKADIIELKEAELKKLVESGSEMKNASGFKILN